MSTHSRIDLNKEFPIRDEEALRYIVRKLGEKYTPNFVVRGESQIGDEKTAYRIVGHYIKGNLQITLNHKFDHSSVNRDFTADSEIRIFGSDQDEILEERGNLVDYLKQGQEASTQ